MKDGKVKVVFVSVGSDESHFCQELKRALSRKSPEWDLRLIIGHGSDEDIDHDQITGTLDKNTDLVVIGMSDPNPPDPRRRAESSRSSNLNIEPELYAGQIAAMMDIPVAMYGNIPGAWQRACRGEPFEELAPITSIYFGSGVNETAGAAGIFKDAIIFNKCNPTVYGSDSIGQVMRAIHNFLLSQAARRCE